MKIFQKIASLALVACVLGSASAFSGNTVVFAEETSDAPLLNFQIVSDIHYSKGGSNFGHEDTRVKFLSALDYNAEHFSDSDALVVAGDFTVSGTEAQYEEFFGDVVAKNTAKNAIVAFGNHEYEFGPNGRLGLKDFPVQKERYCRYTGNLVFGKPLEKTYYDYWINGYHFIVINSENWVDGGGRAYISPTQLQWLKRALAQNASPDKPIFLISHQPLEGTIDRSFVWGLGSAAQSVKDILSDYPQAILFSGHLHNGYYGYDAVYNTYFGTLIDLPAFQYNDFGSNDPGTAIGYNVNVYKGRTELVPVDYQNKKILDEEKIVVDRALTDGAYSASDIDVTAKLGGEEVAAITDGNIETSYTFKKGETLVLEASELSKIAGVRIRTAPKVNFQSAIGPYECPYSEGTSYTNSAWGGGSVKADGNLLKEFSAVLPRWGTCMSVGYEQDYEKDLGWVFIEAPCEASSVEITFAADTVISEIALSAEREKVFLDTYEMQMQYEYLDSLTTDQYTEESLQAVKKVLAQWKNTVYSLSITQKKIDECLAALKDAEKLLVEKEKDVTPPVISGADVPETAKVGDVFAIPAVTATDETDGKVEVTFSVKHNGNLLGFIGDSITLKEGTYEFTWTATDSSSNTAKITKTMRVGEEGSSKKGCKSAVGSEVGILSLFAVLCAGVTAKRKKQK